MAAEADLQDGAPLIEVQGLGDRYRDVSSAASCANSEKAAKRSLRVAGSSSRCRGRSKALLCPPNRGRPCARTAPLFLGALEISAIALSFADGGAFLRGSQRTALYLRDMLATASWGRGESGTGPRLCDAARVLRRHVGSFLKTWRLVGRGLRPLALCLVTVRRRHGRPFWLLVVSAGAGGCGGRGGVVRSLRSRSRF